MTVFSFVNLVGDGWCQEPLGAIMPKHVSSLLVIYNYSFLVTLKLSPLKCFVTTKFVLQSEKQVICRADCDDKFNGTVLKRNGKLW